MLVFGFLCIIVVVEVYWDLLFLGEDNCRFFLSEMVVCGFFVSRGFYGLEGKLLMGFLKWIWGLVMFVFCIILLIVFGFFGFWVCLEFSWCKMKGFIGEFMDFVVGGFLCLMRLVYLLSVVFVFLRIELIILMMFC